MIFVYLGPAMIKFTRLLLRNSSFGVSYILQREKGAQTLKLTLLFVYSIDPSLDSALTLPEITNCEKRSSGQSETSYPPFLHRTALFLMLIVSYNSYLDPLNS